MGEARTRMKSIARIRSTGVVVSQSPEKMRVSEEPSPVDTQLTESKGNAQDQQESLSDVLNAARRVRSAALESLSSEVQRSWRAATASSMSSLVHRTTKTRSRLQWKSLRMRR